MYYNTAPAPAEEDAAMAWGVHRAPEIHNNGCGDSPADRFPAGI
jgi:hypothetical protein